MYTPRLECKSVNSGNIFSQLRAEAEPLTSTMFQYLKLHPNDHNISAQHIGNNIGRSTVAHVWPRWWDVLQHVGYEYRASAQARVQRFWMSPGQTTTVHPQV